MHTVEDFHFKESFCFYTIQLYDFHPLPLDILTHKAEALVFKVILELRINLHEDKVEAEHQPNAHKNCITLQVHQEDPIPQSDVCAFLPHTVHLHKVCLEYRSALSTRQI